MNGPDTSDPLLETLRLAQRLGFFGAAPMETALEHARGFVAAIGDLAAGARIADIGSGGGLPGLVIATAFPHAEVTLIDRRQKRTDYLERAVQRLGLENTTVRCDDVVDIGRRVGDATSAAWDVVTARGFGPPEATLRLGVQLLGTTGHTIVISEPPEGDRWDPTLLESLGLAGRRIGPVRRFDRLPVL